MQLLKKLFLLLILLTSLPYSSTTYAQKKDDILRLPFKR